MLTNESETRSAPARSKNSQLTLFHLTTAKNAQHIATRGFVDNSARHLEGAEYNGVWLGSSPPKVGVVGGGVLLTVNLDLESDALNRFEWRSAGGDSREWLIPADLANAHLVSLAIGPARPEEGVSARAGTERPTGEGPEPL
jgi:hypothetical protein